MLREYQETKLYKKRWLDYFKVVYHLFTRSQEVRHLVLSTARAQGYVGIAQRLLSTLGRENKHGGDIESSI